jgi:predicted ribosome quality control (RQC) complex YloA/Tae2 family protein
VAFDALTLSAVRDELEPLLTEARLQKLVFIDELSLAAEAFAPRVGRNYVLFSAHLEHGRVQRLSSLPARGVEGDSPFSLLVRKHLRNARIRSVRQPRLERVLELDCEQRDPDGRPYRVALIVEAMGRRSNLVLVGDDGAILDAARRTPPSRNPRRPVLPHLRYAPPPPQDRLFPEQISAESLALAPRGQAMLARYLSERIAGLSPLAARELAFRAVGDAGASVDGVDWTAVARAAVEFLSVIDTHAWQPTVALDADERPLDFAPYRLEHLAAAGARLAEIESISTAMETYYTRVAEAGPAHRGDALAAERKALLAPLDRARQTLQRRVAALEHQLSSAHEQRDRLRRAGESILAYQAFLPFGSTELVTEGERFELDPELSAVDNAQEYFARYRKAREAEDHVPPLLETARNQAANIDQLRALVEVADRMDAVRALRREISEATGGRDSSRAARPSPRSSPFRRIGLGDGYEALVGTSAAGNVAVTFDMAQPDDVWVHARGVPGAHVILRTNGAAPPERVIERAAQLAAWHSAARASGSVEVDVAPRRYVKKIPNAPDGLVRYTNERTIRVAPSQAPGSGMASSLPMSRSSSED